MTKQSIGPFRLHRRLGRGGMADVWLARPVLSADHVASGESFEEVAVKVITARFRQQDEYVAAFENEVRAVASLNHPGIINVFDYGEAPVVEWDGDVPREAGNGVSPFIAMEVLRGGPIDAKKIRTWAQLEPVLLNLLDALGYAHACGVVHRDLKPDNVLFASPVGVDSDAPLPRPVLTDFGIARATEEVVPTSLQADTTTGTPAYMAPEQVRGQHRLQGPWTDLYAFGCLVFKLVSGAPPYHGGSITDVMRGHLVDPLPALSPVIDAPPELELWLHRLLAKEPVDRFQRAADAATALRELSFDDNFEVLGTGQHTVIETRIDGLRDVETSNHPVARDPSAAEIGYPLLEFTPELPEQWAREHGRRTQPSLMGLGLFGLRRVPMVARTSIRDQMWQALRSVHAGEGARALVLRGPAGTGKSRLAQWLCERAGECGAVEVLRARHGPMAGTTRGLPSMIAHQVLGVGYSRDEVEEHLYSMVGLLGVEFDNIPALVDLIAPATGDDGGIRLGSARERYVAISRLLSAATRRPPRTAVVWLDDAQWGADALGLVDFMLEQQSNRKVLFIITIREQALGERPLEQRLLEGVEALDRSTRIDVPPLSSAEQFELVNEMLGLSPLVAQQIVERSEGNPLFAVQLVEALVNDGHLEPTPTGFVVAEGVEIGLPRDLRELWQNRMDKLAEEFGDEPVLLALELAATLGQEIDPDEWRLLCDHEGVAVSPGLLRHLVDRRLATDVRAGTARGSWAFAHGMFREWLVERATLGERWDSHNSACASVLSSHYPADLRGVSERIGRHLLAAKEFEAALEPLRRAADELHVTSDFQQAEELLDLRDKVLDVLGVRTADTRRVQGTLIRARCWMKRAETDKAIELLDNLLLTAQVLGLRHLEGEALVVRGMVATRRGVLDECAENYTTALAIFESLGDEEWVARALHGLAFIDLWRGRFEEVIPVCERARDYLIAAERWHEVGHTLVTMSVACRKSGLREESRTCATEALQWFERAGTRYGMAIAHNDLGETCRLSGDLEAAEVHYRRALEMMQALGSRDASVMRANLGTVLRLRGDTGAARQLLEQSRTEFLASGQLVYIGLVDLDLTLCAGLDQDWAAWDVHARSAIERLGSSGLVDEDVARNAELLVEVALEGRHQARAEMFANLAEAQWRALGQESRAEQVRSRVAK